MSDIRILLLCGSRFALQTMQELAFFNQLAAIAIPSKCDEWLEHTHAVMGSFGIPIITLEADTFAQQLIAAFDQYKANIGLMVTFSYKLPASVYSIPEKGFFNVHPSPLPAYRGADPIFFQIKNQEKLAGVTIHQLDEQFDTGPVVMRELIKIAETDTYGLLSQKVSMVASRLINNLVKLISYDLDIPLKVQDVSKASYYRRQTAKDVSIKWETMTARSVIALINACNPWNKGASARIGPRVIRLLEARTLSRNGMPAAPPGTILSFTGNSMLVACTGEDLLSVDIVSSDEGIMNAARLQESGIVHGMQLETID